jgi:hypothetical protein
LRINKVLPKYFDLPRNESDTHYEKYDNGKLFCKERAKNA